MDKIEQFLQWVNESDNIVFFGGAGVSTESGIPDFRSVDGLYHQKYDYPPETILSHSFYMRKPEEFFRFPWFYETTTFRVKRTSVHVMAFLLFKQQRVGNWNINV